MRRPILALLALTISICALGYIKSRALNNSYLAKSDSVRNKTARLNLYAPEPPDIACTPPPADMVGWWPGEGNANDIQGPAFENGTLMNGATYAPGKVGQAFSFDGVDDYMEVPHSSSLDLTGGFTLDTWFLQRTAGYGVLFSKADYNGSESVTSYGMQVDPDGSINPALYGIYPNDNWTTAPGLVTTGQWYHIALTWDGTYGPANNVKLYLNGALVQSWTKSMTPLHVTSQSLTLGSMKPPTYHGHLDGLIDEPEIFSRELSPTEIQSIFNAGSAGKCQPQCTSPPSGMISWWAGDGNALDLKEVNNAAPQNGAGYASGKVGLGFSLNGTDAFIDVADNASINPQQLTIDAWINVNSGADPAGHYGVITKYHSVDDWRQYEMYIDNQKLTLRASENHQTHQCSITSTSNITFGQWTHVAATVDPTACNLYINGNLEANAAGLNNIQVVPVNLEIGAGGSMQMGVGSFFPGMIDEVEIFGRALSQTEIQAIYNAGSAGKCKPGSTPTLNVNDVTQAEGNAGTTDFDFTVSLSSPAGADGVTFDIATADSTAASGLGDYFAKSLTAQTIPSGSTTYTFTVQVSGDTNVESDETFFVNVTNVAGAAAGDTQGLGTIQNDDLQSDLTISMTDSPDPVTEGNSVTYNIDVTNNGPSNATSVTVTDVLPATVTFVSASTVCSNSSGTVTCSIGNLGNGATANVQITVAPSHDVAGASFSNTASATAAESDPTTPNTATQITEVLGATCATPPTSMIGWWPGQDNADDISGHGNNGTLQNGATFATGKVGQAFNFDGVNDYVAIPNIVNSWPEGTLDTWIKFKDSTPKSSGNYIFAAGTDAGGTNLGIHKAAGNDLRFGIYSGGWQWAATGIVPNAGQWYHVTATWGPAEMKIYIDGTLMGTNPYTGPSFGSTYNMIGGSVLSDSGVNAFVDEFEVYNRALSDLEIQSFYKASTAGKCQLTCTAPPAGMISWWPGQDNANDAIGTNNGTLVNAPTYTAGEVGQSFNFSGSGDYVQVATPVGLPLGNSARTMMMWFKTPNSWGDQHQVVIQYGGNGTASKFGIYIPDYFGRTLSFWGEMSDFAGSTPLQLSTWYHGAVTYDGTTVQLYLNGQPETSQGKSLNTTLNSGGFTIGRTSDVDNITSQWNGLVDEAMIFDHALSQTEIQSIYNSGYAGECHPTDITLSSDTVPENQPAGSAIGTLTTTGGDAGDTHTYSLVTGTGDTDNPSFTIVGDQLKTVAAFDYETKSSYSIRVRSTNQASLFAEKAFTITVTDVNEPPTDMALSNASIAENSASGSTVGTLSTNDPDVGDTYIYSLVSGDGSDDNASFTISGSQLQTAAVFDYETKTSYTIRVGATLATESLTLKAIGPEFASFVIEKQFTINVTNVNESPATGIVISQVYGGAGSGGANYKNDFIELFNLSNINIDLAGWSVQYASTNGTSWQVTPLCPSGACYIAPGQYFLVKEAAFGGGTVDLPAPDVTGTIPMSNAAGKVALVASTTPPFSGVSCPTGATVVDFVGYGTGTNCFEGGGPTSSTSNITAALRKNNGCLDTDNNNSDFDIGTPNPRNSASPLNNCAVPPTLGNYANTSVSLSSNATITPDAAPTNATSINVSSSTNFKGTLSAEPATGVVRVTNAHPAGTHTVTVRAFNGSLSVTRNFTLTVQTGTACAGTSTFTNAADSSVGSHPYSVAIGDFNNDSKQDIATANRDSDNVSIRLGDGLGGFSGTTDVSVGDVPRGVAIGDFNNDGKQDIAVANDNSSTVSIRLGDGTGGFTGTTEVSVGSRPFSVAIGDFNNDGKQDIATNNYSSDTVSIRLGDGLGGFTGTTEVSVGDIPYAVAIGDFDDNGNQDLAAVNIGSDSVSIRLGDGSGGFTGTTEDADRRGRRRPRPPVPSVPSSASGSVAALSGKRRRGGKPRGTKAKLPAPAVQVNDR